MKLLRQQCQYFIGELQWLLLFGQLRCDVAFLTLLLKQSFDESRRNCVDNTQDKLSGWLLVRGVLFVRKEGHYLSIIFNQLVNAVNRELAVARYIDALDLSSLYELFLAFSPLFHELHVEVFQIR